MKVFKCGYGYFLKCFYAEMHENDVFLFFLIIFETNVSKQFKT